MPCAGSHRCFFSPDNDREDDLLLDYPLSVQESMRLGLRTGQCPHRLAMRSATEAQLIIGDYNQMFCRGPNILQRLGRKESEAVLVIDEAHNLPSRVMGANSGGLAAGTIERVRALPSLKQFAEDLDLLADVFRGLCRRGPEDRRCGHRSSLMESCGVDAGGLAEEIEAAAGEGADIGALVDFLHSWSAADEATVRYLDGDPPRLKVSLVDPRPIIAPVLERVRSALIMSGTLHPPEMFADLLGARNAVCRAYPSPFPKRTAWCSPPPGLPLPLRGQACSLRSLKSPGARTRCPATWRRYSVISWDR